VFHDSLESHMSGNWEEVETPIKDYSTTSLVFAEAGLAWFGS